MYEYQIVVSPGGKHLFTTEWTSDRHAIRESVQRMSSVFSENDITLRRRDIRWNSLKINEGVFDELKQGQ